MCEGSYLQDGTYIPKGEEREITYGGVKYRCVGCGGCIPISSGSFTRTPSYIPSQGLTASQQMQLQAFQGFMAPFFSALGSIIHQSMMELFTSQTYDTHYQKQQEEAKKKAFEAWQKYMKEAEEQARKEEEERKRAGQDILSQVRIGSVLPKTTIIGPKALEKETLSKIDWNNPRPHTDMTPKYTETAKEQLLKAAYFSKMAETFLQSGDLEAARFYAELAFEGDIISPRPINYVPPKELLDAMDSKKAIELNQKLTNLAKFYRLAMPEIEKLQGLYVKLEDVKTKKEESKKKIEELEKQIKELEIKKQFEEITNQKIPSEINNLLSQALALKQKAEKEYQETVENEQKLIAEKQRIEKEIDTLKQNLFKEVK